MRILLNTLAVIIGLATGVLAVACIAAAIAGAVAGVGGKTLPLGTVTHIVGILFVAGLAFIYGLIASRALLHLLHPDAGTARDMIGTAIYLIVMMAVLPLGRMLQAPGSLLLASVIGLYVFHRWLVKRIVARAFPPAAAESHA